MYIEASMLWLGSKGPFMPDEKAPVIPPVVCNRFVINSTPENCKITLGYNAVNGEETTFFSCITLSTSDARWLADAIEKTISEAEAKAMGGNQGL